jgi:PAS domain S-box-containing protein
VSAKEPVLIEGVAQEVAALIATLQEAGQRLEELTAGEVDTVADRDGRAFVLRHAQEQLRINDAAKQAAILNALPAHIALLDTDGFIVSANQAWRQFADANGLHSPGHAVGVNYLAICDHAQGAGSSEAYQVAHGIRSVLTRKLKSFSIEYPCHSAIEQRWFSMTVTPMAYHGANGAVVIHSNITERKRSEDALRASEQMQRQQADRLQIKRIRLLAAQRIAKIGSWETDVSSSTVAWSPEMHRIFETDAATFSITHQNILKFVHVEDRARVADAYAKSLTRHTAYTIQHRLQLPNARIKYVEQRWQVAFDEQEDAIRVVGSCQDITERKWADELVRQSSREGTRKQRIRVFIDLGILAIGTGSIYALGARFDLFDAITRRVLLEGQLDEAIVAAMFLSAALVVFAFRRMHESQASLRDQQRVQGALRLLHDDLDRQVEVRTEELGKANDALNSEIDERKLAEAWLRESERRLSSMLSNVDLLSLMLDEQGRITYCNEYLLTLCGWRREEVLGKSWSEWFVPAEIQPPMDAMFLDLLANIPPAWHHENEILTRSGVRRLIRWNNTLLHSASGSVIGTASIGEDITQRTEQEEKITRLNRIRAVMGGVSSAMLRLKDRDELLHEACRVAATEGVFPLALIGAIDAQTGKFEIVTRHGANSWAVDIVMKLYERKSWPE